MGREGPSVHIGAGIASVSGRRLGLSAEHIKSLIPVGTAAAVAAAFNTPLAAVVFALEEIVGDLHAPVIGSVVLASATSWGVLRLLLGNSPLFKVPQVRRFRQNWIEQARFQERQDRLKSVRVSQCHRQFNQVSQTPDRLPAVADERQELTRRRLEFLQAAVENSGIGCGGHAAID